MGTATLVAALVAFAPAPSAHPEPEVPAAASDPLPALGLERFAWPTQPRQLWLGLGVGGIYLPSSLSGFSRNAWTISTPMTWSLAPTRRVAFGGRHSMVWYDASDTRTRLSDHSGEFVVDVSRLDPRRQHRVSATADLLELDKFRVNESGVELGIGGVRSTVLGLGYSARFVLGSAWVLGWQAHLRYAWVFSNTQRQARVALRGEYYPRPNQNISATLVGHFVHRDEEQYAKNLTRTTVHGQLRVGYGWMSRALTEGPRPFHLGWYVNLRAATSFLSGEAPVYEVRNDTLTTPYGDAHVGMHARW